MSDLEIDPTPEPRSEEALFEAAVRLTGEERSRFMDGACHGDPALRRRLEALIAASVEADSFLEPEPSPDAKATKTLKLDVPDESVGQKIGRYKILEKVGEGGCGVVYVAEQTEPVRRRVALKVIKLGMDTKQVVARFEAERQALAMMDHPNIARVLDAGATDTGRPYFIMELVRGIRITDYCDQANLSTQGRLDLFIQVCHAIQHAHQKGIIHRDIKPSNILVTLHDGVPVPKVIDFGIAKATEGRLTDATVYTQLHQFIGTPAYMSPEQAEMSGLDIDTRSDIYSLGVLLYELLAGSTPFDGQELMSMGIDAMRKIIREQEPARPSTRFATLQGDDRTTTAKRRSTDAPKLIHLLEGDLDWIVMKCLEKDRTRRYETANGVAMDIQRYLNNEPVVARAPSFLYRAQKFCRRNKAAMVVVNGVALILVIATGVSAYFAVALKNQRDIATQALARAEREAAISEAVNRFLNRDILGAANAREQNNKDITLREILDRTGQTLETTDFKYPQVESEIRLTLARTYSSLGEYDKAERQYDEGLKLLRDAVGEESAQTANTLMAIAHHFEAQASFTQASRYASKAIEILEREGDRSDPLLMNAYCLRAICTTELSTVSRAEATVQIKELIATAEDNFPGNTRLQLGLHGGLSMLLVNQGQLDEASRVSDRIRELADAGGVPLNARFHYIQGVLHYNNGDAVESRASWQRALELTESLFEPTDPGYLVYGYDIKGRLLMLDGNLEGARQYYTFHYPQVVNDEEYSSSRLQFVHGYMHCLLFLGLSDELVTLISRERADARSTGAGAAFTDYHFSWTTTWLSSVHTLQGEYGKALDEFTGMTDMDTQWGLDWLFRSVLMLRLGKQQEFEQHRLELTRRYENWEDGFTMGLILPAYLACADAPPSADQAIIRRWMGCARVKVDEAGPFLRHWLEFCLGVAHFRFGELEPARNHLTSALQGLPHCEALSRLVLAQVEQELGNVEVAATHLERADSMRKRWVVKDPENLAFYIPEMLLYDQLREEFSSRSALPDHAEPRPDQLSSQALNTP